jgi:hypothetical protein
MFFKIKWVSKLMIFSLIFSQVAFGFFYPLNAHAAGEALEITQLLNFGAITAADSANTAAIGTVDASVIASKVAILAGIIVALGAGGASVLSSSNMNGVMSDVEKRYHIQPTAIQNLGETMNTSTNKESAPSVNLFFSPTDPKIGKEVSAQAFPLYFSNQKEDLYFTWYLKRKECDEKDGNLTSNEKSLCDLDNSGKITTNDWKIEAMRRITNGGFAGDQVDYTQSSNDNDEYKAQFGGNKSTSGYCYVHNFETGIDYELTACKHLFPNAPGGVTGDGSFGNNEEKFWHTDPADPSTAQNGNKDEANIVGLGQDTFKWNYAAEDRVGVVIEGLSMNPTKHDDSSMMIMWAFGKNKCTPKPTGSFIDGKAYNGGSAQIPTAIQDLNDCIKDNLVDPTDGGQASKFEVQVSTSPENPILDSFSKNKPDNRGNVLTAQAVAVNSATKDSNISYNWKVYANSNQSQTDDTAWEDITSGLIDAHAVSSVSGSDLASLKINLNIKEGTKVNGQDFFERYFKDETGYFRINVTATENFDVGKKRVGRGSTVAKIVRAKAQIQTHAVDVDANGKLKFTQSSNGDNGMLCEDGVMDRMVCPVVKGQIIGLSVDVAALGFKPGSGATIAWLINNKPFHCNAFVSSDSGCTSGEKNFFPVTGDIDEMYTVTMTVNDPVSGKSVALNRVFRMVKPSVLVVSGDTGGNVWPKYLGQYVDTNRNTTDNYSKDVFESFSGEKFTLRGLFYPNSLKSGANMSWLLDGTPVTPDNQGMIVVDATQKAGSIHTVSLNGAYTPSVKIKKALFDIWGISVADASEVNFSHAVQVELLQKTDGLAMGPLDSSKKFFASIIAYVPVSVIFLFRLVVTMGLILLVLGIAFSFVSEKRKV